MCDRLLIFELQMQSDDTLHIMQSQLENNPYNVQRNFIMSVLKFMTIFFLSGNWTYIKES